MPDMFLINQDEYRLLVLGWAHNHSSVILSPAKPGVRILASIQQSLQAEIPHPVFTAPFCGTTPPTVRHLRLLLL